jgi:hypothetical protein
LDGNSATISTVLAVEFVGGFTPPRRPETHNAGPPIDLVVAFRHLLI